MTVHGHWDDRFAHLVDTLAEEVQTGAEASAALGSRLRAAPAGNDSLCAGREDLLLGWLGRVVGGSARTDRYFRLVYDAL
ncbi:hypothetical protein [Mycolicibacterium cosmeticum]|uniref:hypothetical protein n=1 Tax=Mycolicibacterium cosmeticum TaxID=258533 RepID=UPI003D1622F3